MLHLHDARRVGRLTCLLAIALGLAGTARADLVSVTRTVDAHDGPWEFTPGGLNTTFQWGLNNHAPPVTVSGADGFDFTPGRAITVIYLSGSTSAEGDFPFVDARGYTDPQFSHFGSNNPGLGNFYPSHYMNRTEYPVFLNALVGTFADDTGAIVDTPFSIDLARTLTIPLGATRLQLGINDDNFADDQGALVIAITQNTAAVPEPAGLALVGAGGLTLALRHARQRRRGGVTARRHRPSSSGRRLT